MQAGVSSQGGALVASAVDDQLVPFLRAKSVCGRLGAEIRTGLIPNLSLPIVTGDFNAQWLSEFATASEGDLTVAQAVLSPHRVTITLTASKLLPTQSRVDFFNSLAAQARDKLFQALDQACLTGAGGATPLGILNTANVGKVTFGAAASWTKILSFESTIGNANADGSSLGWAQSPNTRARWKQIQRASGTSTFLQDDQNRVTGYPAYMTTELNSTAANDQCIFGNWADLVIGTFFDSVFVVSDPYSKSATGEDVYTWTLYADCGPRHAASFCISTDSAAQ
jgi:HK97 family phage major capsid protein